MANYPCPVCGASHKAPPEKCRLCGQSMGEEDAVGDFSGSSHQIVKKKGIGGLAVLVALMVIVVIFGLVLLGLVPGRQAVTDVVSKVPGVGGGSSIGWAVLQDSEGGFSLELPSETPEKSTEVELPFAVAEGTTGYTAWIGDDTLVRVTYTPDVQPDGLLEFDAITEIQDAWKQTLIDDEIIVSSTSETFVGDHPARIIEARGIDLEEQPDESFNLKAIAFYSDGTLYTIEAYSDTVNSTAFDRASRSFVFLNPVPADDGVTTTTN